MSHSFLTFSLITFYMRKILLTLMAVAGAGFGTTQASSIAEINAVQSPVWLWRNNVKSELSEDSLLASGDRIVSGANGRAAMQLWSSVSLHLHTGSQFSLPDKDEERIAREQHYREIHIQKGRACVRLSQNTLGVDEIKINIADKLFASVFGNGTICAYRHEGLSAVRLHSGSAQVMHSVDPNTVILSVAGTEYQVDDKGASKFLAQGAGLSFDQAVELPFKGSLLARDKDLPAASQRAKESKVDLGKAPQAPSKSSPPAPQTVPEPTKPPFSPKDTGSSKPTAKPAPAKPAPAKPKSISAKTTTATRLYTVYLHSTRAIERAEKLNQRLRNAGYHSEVFSVETDSGTIHRVGVTGFETKKSAQDFSKAIVGKQGIEDTWIGWTPAKKQP